jgi:hypothetical protein
LQKSERRIICGRSDFYFLAKEPRTMPLSTPDITFMGPCHQLNTLHGQSVRNNDGTDFIIGLDFRRCDTSYQDQKALLVFSIGEISGYQVLVPYRLCLHIELVRQKIEWAFRNGNLDLSDENPFDLDEYSD